MEKQKISFRDLGLFSKIGIISGWLFLIYFIGMFLISFITGLSGSP